MIEDSKTAGEGTAGRYSRSVGRKRKKHADEVDCEMLRTYSTGLLAVALGGYESALPLFLSVMHDICVSFCRNLCVFLKASRSSFILRLLLHILGIENLHIVANISR